MDEKFGNISFKQIEVFLTVAAHKSFSSAASSLFLHQSSISRNIKCLEDALELQLFERNDKGAVLTDAGKILYREFSDQMNRLNDIIHMAKTGLDYVGKKVIRIGCLESDEVKSLATPIIQAYQALHPELKLDLEFYPFSELRDKLIYGFLDCIFTFGIGFGALRNIKKVNIKRVDSYFAVSSSHPMINSTELDMKSLADSTLYLLSGAEMQEPEERAVRICRRYGFEPKALSYEPTRQKIEIAVKNGYGFTIDGLDFAKRFPKEITLFKINHPVQEQFIILAWHENHCPDVARDFIEDTLKA